MAINTTAFTFLLPTAMLVPWCAWAGYRIASGRKGRGVLVAGTIILVLFGCALIFAMQFGVAMSPGRQDGTYFNTFYWQQPLMAPLLELCALLLGFWSRRSPLYSGIGLIALGTAIPTIWWGASRTGAAFSPQIAGLLAALLGALVGAAAARLPLLPEVASRVRALRLVLWTAAGVSGAVSGLLLGFTLGTTSPWEAASQRGAADPVLPTLLLIIVLITAGLMTALPLAAPARR